MIREYLLKKVEAVMASRQPDFEIGPEGDRYMLRWHLTPWSTFDRRVLPKTWREGFKRKLPSIYAHKFLHDDEDRALHDHPWASCSFLLKGNYWEVMFYPLAPERIAQYVDAGKARPTVKIFRAEGTMTFRGAEEAHRIVLERGADRETPKQVVSLFITGFRVRDWGFICPKGFRHWKTFVGDRDRGSVGRGCE